MNARFSIDQFHQLTLIDLNGQTHCPVQVVKAFPLSAPDNDWFVLNLDGQMLEAIASPSELDASDRALLEQWFAERAFCPDILSIDAVESFSTPSTWHVTTTQGKTHFVLQGEEDIRRLQDRRLLITSRSGTQFCVPDRLALDRSSRTLLDRFL